MDCLCSFNAASPTIHIDRSKTVTCGGSCRSIAARERQRVGLGSFPLTNVAYGSKSSLELLHLVLAVERELAQLPHRRLRRPSSASSRCHRSRHSLVSSSAAYAVLLDLLRSPRPRRLTCLGSAGEFSRGTGSAGVKRPETSLLCMTTHTHRAHLSVSSTASGCDTYANSYYFESTPRLRWATEGRRAAHDRVNCARVSRARLRARAPPTRLALALAHTWHPRHGTRCAPRAMSRRRGAPPRARAPPRRRRPRWPFHQRRGLPRPPPVGRRMVRGGDGGPFVHRQAQSARRASSAPRAAVIVGPAAHGRAAGAVGGVRRPAPAGAPKRAARDDDVGDARRRSALNWRAVRERTALRLALRDAAPSALSSSTSSLSHRWLSVSRVVLVERSIGAFLSSRADQVTRVGRRRVARRTCSSPSGCAGGRRGRGDERRRGGSTTYSSTPSDHMSTVALRRSPRAREELRPRSSSACRARAPARRASAC